MKCNAEGKMRGLAQAWTQSQENWPSTAFSVSKAISHGGSHPSPSFTQGDFSGSQSDLHPVTSL